MSNNEEEVLANFSEVMQQYREENSSSSANDIFFGARVITVKAIYYVSNIKKSKYILTFHRTVAQCVKTIMNLRQNMS